MLRGYLDLLWATHWLLSDQPHKAAAAAGHAWQSLPPAHRYVRGTALQVFAFLSSRLAFWWWHVHGDGFHVSKHVIETMPVGEAFRSPAFSVALMRLGGLLWDEVKASPVISRNRGRTSLGFSAVASPLREQIDALLMKSLGLPPCFALELERFCEGVRSAQLPPRTDQDNQRTHQ